MSETKNSVSLSPSSVSSTYVIGIDVSDQQSQVCILDSAGRVVGEHKVKTTPAAFGVFFATYAGCRVALEVGAHSHWMSELLSGVGCSPLVANARRLGVITKSQRKNDRNDAKMLAELLRAAPHLLQPVEPRSQDVMEARCLLKARDALVRTRTNLVNAARGLVKPFGIRLPKCSTPSFAKKAAPHITDFLQEAVEPLLGTIALLTSKIACLDRKVEDLADKKYPATKRLQEVVGVGPLTALAFVLAVGNAKRFKKSRAVGAYFGLTPGQFESGTKSPQLGITKCGDPFVRRLLINCSQYILGPFGPECDLRTFGEALCKRGARNAKKRAVVAVARKLAVMMHRLLVSDAAYQPQRQAPAALATA